MGGGIEETGRDKGFSAGGLCRKRRSWRGLDILATLHFWLILSGLHLDGHHVVAGRYVVVPAVRHLFLGHDAVDFCNITISS